MGDFRDIHRDGNDPVSQHGVNDPVGGVDVKRRFHDNASPHERNRSAAMCARIHLRMRQRSSCRRR